MDDLEQLQNLTSEDVQILGQLGVRFDPSQNALVGSEGLSHASRQVLWNACAASAEYFVIDSQLVKTLDNQRKFECVACGRVIGDFLGKPCDRCGAPMRLRDPVQPFPTNRYGPRYVLRLLKICPELAIKKSRRRLATETICAYTLHLLMFRKGTLAVFQYDTEEKANNSVRRVYRAWAHLPEWMKRRRPCNPTKSGEEIEGYFEIPNNYSRLVAIPSGPDKIRELGPSLYVCDEAAFHTDAEATYRATRQAIEAGCQAVWISTAAAGFFAALTNDCLEAA